MGWHWQHGKGKAETAGGKKGDGAKEKTGDESTHFAQSIENVVEVNENLALGDLCNIVHGLTCIVANAGILVGEASQHRLYNSFEISWKLLYSGRRETNNEQGDTPLTRVTRSEAKEHGRWSNLRSREQCQQQLDL